MELTFNRAAEIEQGDGPDPTPEELAAYAAFRRKLEQGGWYRWCREVLGPLARDFEATGYKRMSPREQRRFGKLTPRQLLAVQASSKQSAKPLAKPNPGGRTRRPRQKRTAQPQQARAPDRPPRLEASPAALAEARRVLDQAARRILAERAS